MELARPTEPRGESPTSITSNTAHPSTERPVTFQTAQLPDRQQIVVDLVAMPVNRFDVTSLAISSHGPWSQASRRIPARPGAMVPPGRRFFIAAVACHQTAFLHS